MLVCRYTSLPAFTVPAAAQGFKSCEMTMGRRNVHACHAGALVHSLEAWKHHEVSPKNNTLFTPTCIHTRRDLGGTHACLVWRAFTAPARLHAKRRVPLARKRLFLTHVFCVFVCWQQVGAIDAERIDLTWEAAMKHGFALVPDPL